MRIHLQDSNERRHYVIKRLETVDAKIQTLYTGTFTAPYETLFAPHKHTFIEIMYIDKGCGIIEINNQKYTAKEGDVVIYFPNLFHKEYSIKKGNQLHALFFAVRYTNALQEMFENFSNSYVFPSGDNRNILESSMKYLINESQKDGVPYFDKIANCIAKTIILKILQMSLDKEQATESNEFVKSVQQYLDDHYLEDINLDEYYNSLPFSKYYISRLFKTCMGITPINYIISKRMDLARELLNNTDKKIQDIANEVGYKDIYYFTKTFKKEIGVSPTKYRKRGQDLSN